MKHWKLINLFNVIRSTWPKVCTLCVMYPLFYVICYFFGLLLPFYGCAWCLMFAEHGENSTPKKKTHTRNFILVIERVTHLFECYCYYDKQPSTVWWILSKYYLQFSAFLPYHLHIFSFFGSWDVFSNWISTPHIMKWINTVFVIVFFLLQ